MADIADAQANINDVEVDGDAALSEALFEKIGGAINYLNTTTDDHETRITAVESNTANGNSVASGNITGDGAVQSVSITPGSTNVGVLASGVIQSITNATANIEIRRGAVTLLSIALAANQKINLQSMIDTGATADISNSYSIYASSVSLSGGSITYSALSIGAFDAR